MHLRAFVSEIEHPIQLTLQIASGSIRSKTYPQKTQKLCKFATFVWLSKYYSITVLCHLNKVNLWASYFPCSSENTCVGGATFVVSSALVHFKFMYHNYNPGNLRNEVIASLHETSQLYWFDIVASLILCF